MLPVPRPPSLRSGFRAGSLAVLIASRAFSRRMRSLLMSHKTSNGLLRIGGAERKAAVRVEFRRALALRSEIRRAGWFNSAVTDHRGGPLMVRGAVLVRVAAFD